MKPWLKALKNLFFVLKTACRALNPAVKQNSFSLRICGPVWIIFYRLNNEDAEFKGIRA